MAKLKLDDGLMERVKKVADAAGYATAEEFIVHVLEKELSVIESAESDGDVEDRLRGLGYLE